MIRVMLSPFLRVYIVKPFKGNQGVACTAITSLQLKVQTDDLALMLY
jgi:hypothetical protein